MNTLLKLEFAALFALSLFLFSMLPYAWWWYPALLLVPDIGMLGYLVNPKIGAMTYNLTHWLVLGVALNIIGHTAGLPLVALAGVIIVGHSALDRILGFGLKYTDSFRHTHLGHI
jgi:hypothetical protein